MAIENTTLYYRDGSSDKVYQAAIEERDGGFIVSFAFGRRGSTLTTGVKTAAPVALAAAKKIYDKLVNEKKAKGYTPGEEGTPYVHTDKEQRATGLHCQLLNPVDDDELERLIRDGAYWAQEKKDGKRVLVRHEGGSITGVNRKGLSIGLPGPVEAYARKLGAAHGDFVMDGECIGERLHAFDLLFSAGSDLRESGYGSRLDRLQSLLGAGGAIAPVQTARSVAEKRALCKTLMDEQREGVVLKLHDAPYKAGRPSTGGTQLKYKFYATASVLVNKVNTGKRSVAMEVLDGKGRTGIGNVTIPPNATIPAAGEIVEVRYLYAYRGGSLFQPTFLGVRSDVDSSACLASQLKFRAEDEDDDAQ